MLDIVILAAGKGTRMCSSKPKVLHTLAGRPLITHVIDCAIELKPNKIHVVVGSGAEAVANAVASPNLNFIEQKEQLGTGHAVQQALPALSQGSTVLILYGDVPLIKSSTLQALLQSVTKDGLSILTLDMQDPSGYGRIIRDGAGKVLAIVEDKDASLEQRTIREVNTGVIALSKAQLQTWLPKLKNDNSQEEYYLTDIISLAQVDGATINTVQPADSFEVLGVNTRQQQAQLERLYQLNLANQLMQAGLTLIDPNRFDCRGNLTIGQDCIVDINCIFEGDVSLGNNVEIGPNCCLKNVKVGDNCQVLANTVIDGAEFEQRCTVGPFARIRPGTHLAVHAKIGNFVEIKQAVIGEASKVNHLSYIGDAEIGTDVNIGAGTITCNYDGANKHKTVIKDGAFVGSNSALVAPVALGKNSTVAAGSVVTSNAQEGQLVVGRSGQRNIDGWKRPKKK